MFKALFALTHCKILQLECNSYQALYLVQCCDETIETSLIKDFDLVRVCVESVSIVIARIRSKKSYCVEMEKELLL